MKKNKKLLFGIGLGLSAIVGTGSFAFANALSQQVQNKTTIAKQASDSSSDTTSGDKYYHTAAPRNIGSVTYNNSLTSAGSGFRVGVNREISGSNWTNAIFVYDNDGVNDKHIRFKASNKDGDRIRAITDRSTIANNLYDSIIGNSGLYHTYNEGIFIRRMDNLQLEIGPFDDFGCSGIKRLNKTTACAAAFSNDDSKLLVVGADGTFIVRDLNCDINV